VQKHGDKDGQQDTSNRKVKVSLGHRVPGRDKPEEKNQAIQIRTQGKLKQEG
jgi:hypothetical protein